MRFHCPSESWHPASLASVLVGCSPHALGLVGWASGSSEGRTRSLEKNRSEHPLLGFCSSSEYSQTSSGRLPDSRSCHAAPPLRFWPLQRFPAQGSGSVERACLSRSPCAFRFSQPLDALIRPEPANHISGWIRSWGFCPSEPSSSCAAVRRFQRRSPLDVRQQRAALGRSANAEAAYRPTSEFDLDAPHLQGFAPHRNPPLAARGLDRQQRVALLGFPPPGSSADGTELLWHSPYPPEVDARGLRPTLLFRVLIPSGIGPSPQRRPTLLGFSASIAPPPLESDAIRESPPQVGTSGFPRKTAHL
jgi:hypothetical protein